MENITCQLLKDGEIECENKTYVEEVILNYTDKWFWIYLGIYVFLVLFAGNCVVYLCCLVEIALNCF